MSIPLGNSLLHPMHDLAFLKPLMKMRRKRPRYFDSISCIEGVLVLQHITSHESFQLALSLCSNNNMSPPTGSISETFTFLPSANFSFQANLRKCTEMNVDKGK